MNMDPPLTERYTISMPRRPRVTPGGLIYHVLNRAVARLTLFQKDSDYEAFERVMTEAMDIPLYGRVVPTGQSTPTPTAGTYTDTLLVTIAW